MYLDLTRVHELLDAAPRDNSGARAIVVLLDPGSSAWNPEGPKAYHRPEEKRDSIPLVYLRSADGIVCSRMVARPGSKGGETT